MLKLKQLAVGAAALGLTSLAAAPAFAQNKQITLCWAAWDPANALVELSKDFTAKSGIQMKFEFVPWPNFADPVFTHRFQANQLDAQGKPYRFAVFAYRVRPVNALGVEAGPSPYFLTIPSSPLSVFSKEEGDKCHLKWAANPEQGLKGYRVYRMDSPRVNGPGQPVTRVTAEPVAEPRYSDAERAALDLAVAAGAVPSRVTDDLFARLRQYWSEEQVVEIVAAVAMALTKRDPSKNHFQSIHAELHRRFKARSYSLIRVEQYAAVLKFLETWDAAMLGREGDE